MLELNSIRCGDDQELSLIQGLQAGSDEAFDWLIGQYAAALYRLAHRLLNEPSEASDVAQEVFLKVFRNIGQFQNHCSLKTWIYRIAINTVANHNRWWRRHREQEFPLEAGPDESDRRERFWVASTGDPLESLLSREIQEMVQEALQRLPETARTVLVLREMEELSYQEVAEVLHVSLGTVKSRLARARESLKCELESMRAPAAGAVPAWSPAE